ncbi:MFS transporter [Variovorax sp. LT1P1]|uniref:MFS transporter n=1 Tax=Variovorax sp. LT1P1 TaxID=3443730 RepID=UPI003F478A09
MTSAPVLADRRHLWAFVVGCIAVTLGVLLHLPMFWMGRDDGFRLADMPMDAEMLWGMALIVAGIVVAGFGLIPKALPQPEALPQELRIIAPEDAPLSWAHWRLMIVLTIALVIDVMKPASLGFVVPGMTREYEVARTTIAWLPFAALCGTVIGSVLWGWLADLYGRRASILLSAVMFVGTSICGAMPSLWWNVGMCFLMGAAAGGMLPVAYALLAETMPSRHRGWVLVLVGGLGAVGGYLAASACAAWLEPIFSWRILWFMNLPTGLVLILLNAFIPESPKFLLKLGRVAEMRETLRGFGCIVSTDDAAGLSARRSTARAPRPVAASNASRLSVLPSLVGPTWALSIVAVAWGLVNFGLLLWMPAHLVAKGYSMRLSSELLAASALIALPTVFVAALLYSRWSSKGALLGAIVMTALGLGGVVHLELAAPGSANPVWPIALLIVGINGIIAMLLPYATESYPLAVRGRATGWVAACTKGGGLAAQLLSLLGLVPSLLVAAVAILAPLLTSLVLVAWFCRETRGRDLRELEVDGLGERGKAFRS